MVEQLHIELMFWYLGGGRLVWKQRLKGIHCRVDYCRYSTSSVNEVLGVSLKGLQRKGFEYKSQSATSNPTTFIYLKDVKGV